MSTTKQIKVTLTKSIFGRVKGHKECVHGLGLRKPHQSVVIAATPENLGMVNKAYYLLKVEEVA